MKFTSIINNMKEIYHDEDFFIKTLNLSDDQMDNLEKMTFVIITNETLKMGLLPMCLDKINNLGCKILSVKLLPYIDEYSLIEHYKYHVHDYVKKIDESTIPYKCSVPSIGWPAVCHRFSNPCIVLLLKGEKSLCNDMLDLKGNCDPQKCNKNQIRYYAPNLVYSLIHSSDDIYSVLRESILFFGKEKIVELLDNKQFNFINYTQNVLNILKKFGDTFLGESLNIEKVIYNVNIRIQSSIVINDICHKSHWICCNNYIQNSRDDNIYDFINYLKKEKIYSNKIDLLEILNNIKCITYKDMYRFMTNIEQEKYIINEWERNMVESHILMRIIKI